MNEIENWIPRSLSWKPVRIVEFGNEIVSEILKINSRVKIT